MRKSKAELESQSRDFQALKQLTQTRGWKLVQQILTDEFNDALDTVSAPKSAKAEIEARGIIRFIKKFTDTLNSEMGFGKHAQEQYVQQYVNKPQDEESVGARGI